MREENVILHLYTSLWNNRSYKSFEHMEQSILSGLSDENTHPRIRRSPEAKLQITIQMISQSNLNSDQQKILIDYVTELFQQNFNK